MKTVGIALALTLISIIGWGQSPQHVFTSSEDGGSLWESTTGIIIFVGFIILLIGGRAVSTRIHKKRDDLLKDKD